QLVATNRNKGWLDPHNNSDWLDNCLDRGDYATPTEICWRLFRYGNRWDTGSRFDAAFRYFRRRGKLTAFMEEVDTRVRSDTNAGGQLADRLPRARGHSRHL